jgi:uncharacterized repeat protein (TIGR01451 family)
MLGSVSIGSTVLVPGQSTSGVKSYTVLESDLPGPIVNNVDVNGYDPLGLLVNDYDTESVSIEINPAIEINKDADVDTAGIGDLITYTYTVTNTGDVTLTGVTVVDDMLGSVSIGSTVLVPGQSTSGVKTYTVLESDLPGPIINNAIATGTPLVGSDITDVDSESVIIEINPAIELDKEADVSLVSVGDIITYTYTVTNTGDVTLTGVTVVDDMLGSVSIGSTVLNPGQSTIGVKIYTVTVSDYPGPVINNAIATGTPPIGADVTDYDTESVTIEAFSAIELNKEADASVVSVGDSITYTYTITNTGDATLTSVTVIDDMLGSVSIGSTVLTPGQSTIGVKTYTVTESDLPGPIINNAIVTGSPPTGADVTDYATESVTIEVFPNLIKKQM